MDVMTIIDLLIEKNPVDLMLAVKARPHYIPANDCLLISSYPQCSNKNRYLEQIKHRKLVEPCSHIRDNPDKRASADICTGDRLRRGV